MLLLLVRFLVGAAISGAIHYYVWRRLVRPAELPRRAHRAITWAMIVLYVAIPVTTWSRNVVPEVSNALAWVTMPWMALAGLTAVALALVDLVRLVVWLARRAVRRPAAPVSPGRRQFLARATGGAVLAVGGTSMARGMLEARGTHEVVDVEVAIARLPKSSTTRTRCRRTCSR